MVFSIPVILLLCYPMMLSRYALFCCIFPITHHSSLLHSSIITPSFITHHSSLITPSLLHSSLITPSFITHHSQFIIHSFHIDYWPEEELLQTPARRIRCSWETRTNLRAISSCRSDLRIWRFFPFFPCGDDCCWGKWSTRMGQRT